MANEKFGGDKKLPMTTLLAPLERRFIDASVGRFPAWIQGWHLTLTTILWSAGVIVFGWLGGRGGNLHWLWLSSVMIFMQWFTDCFDGALGRHRDFGIPRWGYYMDHLLDYVFMCAILIGYTFLLQGNERTIVYLLIPVFGGFMMNAYLAFGATGEFKITYLWTGPTEMRIAFIVLNAILTLFGTAWIQPLLVWILAGAVMFLCFVVFRTQRYVWRKDMSTRGPAAAGERKERPHGGKQDTSPFGNPPR